MTDFSSEYRNLVQPQTLGACQSLLMEYAEERKNKSLNTFSVCSLNKDFAENKDQLIQDVQLKTLLSKEIKTFFNDLLEELNKKGK